MNRTYIDKKHHDKLKAEAATGKRYSKITEEMSKAGVRDINGKPLAEWHVNHTLLNLGVRRRKFSGTRKPRGGEASREQRHHKVRYSAGDRRLCGTWQGGQKGIAGFGLERAE